MSYEINYDSKNGSVRLTFQGAKVMLIDFTVPGQQVEGLIKKNQTF